MDLEVGQRYLIRNCHYFASAVLDARILEVAESWVRVQYLDTGYQCWMPVTDLHVIQKLPAQRPEDQGEAGSEGSVVSMRTVDG